MDYNNLPSTTTQKVTVDSPLFLNKIKEFPRPTVSTRDYFGDFTSSQPILSVPLEVGLEAVDGTIYSVWELEYLKTQNIYPELKNFTTKKGTSGTDGDGYTFFNEKSKAGMFGTHGDRNLVEGTTDTQVTLYYPDIHKTVRGNVPLPVIDPHTQVLTLPKTKYEGSIIAPYEHVIRLDLVEKHLIPRLLATKNDKWFLLPDNTEPLNDTKMIASILELPELENMIDWSTAKAHKLDSTLITVLTTWLASKVEYATKPTYRSNWLVSRRKMVHKGNGRLELTLKRNLPIRDRLPAEPLHYEAIKDIWLDRIQIGLHLDLMMVKGFEIKTKWYKKSFILEAITSDWGKTLLWSAALSRLNLAKVMSFNSMINTVESDGRVGSVSLLDVVRFPSVIFDEAKSIESLSGDRVVNAIKNMATGNVSGNSKNENEIEIIFPQCSMMAADDIKPTLDKLASNEELANRLLYPTTKQGKAEDHFAGYTEMDTEDTLVILLHDMFYERYDLLKDMTPAERSEWADKTIHIDEGTLDRERVKLESNAEPLLPIIEACSLLVERDRPKPFNVNSFNDEDPLAYIGLDNMNRVCFNSALMPNKGLLYFLQNYMSVESEYELRRHKDLHTEKKLGCVMSYGNLNSTFGSSIRGKSTMHVQLDKEIMVAPFEEIEKSITRPDLIKAFKEKDIIPFLAFMRQLQSPNARLTTITARLMAEWSDREIIIKEQGGADVSV